MANPFPKLHRIASFLGSDRMTASTPTSSVMTARSSTLTKRERDELIHRVTTAGDTIPQMPNNDGLITLLQNVSRDVAARKLTNQQIEATAPEVLQAASIIIPLIMAPNDLRHSATVIQCSMSQLPSDQQQKIGRAVTDYFDQHYRLQDRLPRYIKMAKYESGAQPVLVVPTSELDRQFNDDANVFIPSTEALVERCEQTTLFGITNLTDGKATDAELLTSCHRAMESLFDELPRGSYGGTNQSYDRRRTQEKTKALHDITERFVAHEALALSDNPDIAKAAALGKRRIEQKVQDALRKAYPSGGTTGRSVNYRQKSTISLHVPDGRGSQGDPMVVELPAESVIPIFPPGSPHDHIGYFVALDELGNPINVTSEMANSMNLQTEDQETFRSLFRAFGLGDMTPIFGAQHQLATNIYQRVVEAYLKAKLGSTGMSGADIGSDNAVFRCMFSRYLRQRQTRLLFVPKDLLTYYCFKYNENGTGRSKLEELQYVLSLRITLLVCRQMTAMANAMDRRKVTANLPQNFRGNVLQFINDLHRAAVRKMVVTPSLDPDEIQRTITSKSISIAVSNIAGAEDFSIANEANERTAVTIDEALAQDVANLLILGLDLTPSMMNALNDAEFSRSVATNNLMLSRKIIRDQETLCHHNDRFIHMVARYSGPLRDIITNIIKGDDEVDTEKGVGDDKTGGVDVDSVISSLKTALPRPSVAPDHAQFESIEAFVTSIDNMLNAVYPDDLANGDSEVGEGVAFIRALIKAENIRQYVNNSGLNSSVTLPDISQMNNEMHVGMQLRQAIINFKKGIAEQKALLGGDDAGGGDYGASPDQFSSGAPSEETPADDNFEDRPEDTEQIPPEETPEEEPNLTGDTTA